MKKLLLTLPIIISVFACQQDEDITESPEIGFLSMSVTLTITSEEANGRIEAVDTDNFRVTIFDAGGTEILVFDPFSSAPAEVPLPTGEYYVEAHSNNLVDAAFDNPFYFGRSVNFTIDKEETKTVDIVPELANTKVAILYSDNVLNTFDSYTGMVTVVSSGASLLYDQGETREGYFITSPLEVAVNLSYTKLNGTTIDRTFTTTIDDPQPKTLYNINVDATLENGVIIFNIVVDDSFDTIDIDLGEIEYETSRFIYGGSEADYIPWRGKSLEIADGYVHLFLSENLNDGDIQGNNGTWDIMLMKTDVNGEITWIRNYGGTWFEYVGDVAETNDGGFVIVGATESNDFDVSQNYGEADMWVVKTDNLGNLIWEKSLGGEYFDVVHDVEILSDNSIMVFGVMADPQNKSTLFKLDENGNIIWQKQYGQYGEIGQSIQSTSDGGFIAVSEAKAFLGDYGINRGYRDVWVLKLDSNGDIIWGNTYGGSSEDIPINIIENADGFIFAAHTASSDGDILNAYGNWDKWVVQIDPSGNILWSNTFGSTGREEFYSFNVLSNGNYVLAGSTNGTDGDVTGPNRGQSDIWLLSIDPQGNILWDETYGGSRQDWGKSVFETSSGNLLLTCVTTSFDGDAEGSHGDYEMLILKLGPNGEL